jgi:uncharacterized protein (TIGR02996 family)
MSQIDLLLRALHKDSGDETAWLALADALEESGQPERAELNRLTCRLRAVPCVAPGKAKRRQESSCAEQQQRVLELLQSGVLPCVPEVVNSIGMRFALIPAGTFLMGSPSGEESRAKHEGPLHKVTITRPFYLGVHEVTQKQWQAVMGDNPAWFSSTGSGKKSVKGMSTDDLPIEQVSWTVSNRFLKKLAALPDEVAAGRRYRLPTEAEWEYACRAGLPLYQVFHFGNSLSHGQANFEATYPYGEGPKGRPLKRTSAVGSYKPNTFGLYDMHGNVWEWCSDWYARDYYSKSPHEDPSGPEKGSSRVMRGGCWDAIGGYCRSAIRCQDPPGRRDRLVGFRAVLIPGE